VTKDWETHTNDNVPDALRDVVDDLRDLSVVMERLETPFATVPNDQVWKELGLDEET